MNDNDILLHTCCAPCVSRVHEILGASFRVVSYYYNPNIHPRAEYDKRFFELARYSREKEFEAIAGGYEVRAWVQAVKPHRFDGERSQRCRRCIALRLEKTFEKARELSLSTVATTLTISPHKDAGMINELGLELSRKSGIAFLEADFKKEDGYRKSVELARRYDLYRQNYCGCVYSLHDRYSGK